LFPDHALIAVGDRQFFRREERDDPAPLVSDHDLFLNAGGRIAILGRTIGFQREHHALLDLGRMLKRHHARDDRPLVQRQTEAVAELQPEGRHLIRKAEVLRLRHTLQTLSVLTPGLISAMASSTHSRAFLYASCWAGVARPTLKVR